MHEGGGVLPEHRDVRDLLDRHQLCRQALGQCMGIGEGPLGGVDVDHRHLSCSFTGFERMVWDQPRAGAPTDSAARSMRPATSSGCDTIATWLAEISTVVAPIRAANWRSASGGIASSSFATRYQLGSDFHAGTPITSAKADPASGCWTAHIARARARSTSPAKRPTKSSSDNHTKPRWSVNLWTSAGVTGPCESSAPSDSPWSRPNAAM